MHHGFPCKAVLCVDNVWVLRWFAEDARLEHSRGQRSDDPKIVRSLIAQPTHRIESKDSRRRRS